MNERKHKESNSHSLTCHNSHTHSQAPIQSQLTEIDWFRRCMPRSCCACPTTTTKTPATQAGRVSRAWLGPLHTAGRGGSGGVTTQVSPGVLSFAFGALIARQLPVPVLIPTPSILPLTLPHSRQDNEIFAVLLCNWSLEMACYDADAAVAASASATGKHWHILLWHNKLFPYTEKRSITSSLPPSPAQEGVPPFSSLVIFFAHLWRVAKIQIKCDICAIKSNAWFCTM